MLSVMMKKGADKDLRTNPVKISSDSFVDLIDENECLKKLIKAAKHEREILKKAISKFVEKDFE